MQDRFKFRFWNTIRNKYEDTYCCSSKGMTLDYVIPEQCTGLKDKNGKLIYEGDIVYYEKCTNFGLGGYRYARVFWWDNVQGFAIETNYGDYYGLQDFDIEIVGNIHENLDLLENKDE